MHKAVADEPLPCDVLGRAADRSPYTDTRSINASERAAFLTLPKIRLASNRHVTRQRILQPGMHRAQRPRETATND